MDFAFPWPFSQGEWLAWWSAVVTIAFGLVALLAPRLALKVLRLETRPDRPEAVSEVRATLSGFWLGVGICCILLAQPLLYMALGISWALAALGRLISIVADGGNRLYNWVWLALQIALAALPLAFAFGFIP